MKNYYSILNINVNATNLEIKKSYRLLAIKYHPDKNNGDKKLTQKFQEVKEAYDVLIDNIARKNYDEKYSNYFDKKDNETPNETNFNENPQENDDFTPEYKPAFDLFGKKISESTLFFKLPERIGIIIGAYSSLKEDDKPLTEKQKKTNLIKGLIVAIIIYLLIFFLGKPNLTWSFIWFVVTFLVIWFFTSQINIYFHNSFFVGTHGYAQFETSDKKSENCTERVVKFNDISNIYVHFTEVKQNFRYERTDYKYYIFDNENILVDGYSGYYDKNENTSEQPLELNFCRKIEQSWNIYLLNTMEEKLNKDGHISFYLYRSGKLEKFIKIGVNEITFLRDDKEFTYKYDDIKRIYTSGNDLYIEHSNFERKLFFITSGEQDRIPLLKLCNRNFFYKSLEVLLGYSIT